MSDPRIDTVRQIYADFVRGDIAAVLARLAPGVTWGIQLAADNPTGGHILKRLPHYGPFEGVAGVTRFFEQLAEAMQVISFVVTDAALGESGAIYVRTDEHFFVPSTGRKLHVRPVHVWHLDEALRITSWTACVDTAIVGDAMGSFDPLVRPA